MGTVDRTYLKESLWALKHALKVTRRVPGMLLVLTQCVPVCVCACVCVYFYFFAFSLRLLSPPLALPVL